MIVVEMIQVTKVELCIKQYALKQWCYLPVRASRDHFFLPSNLSQVDVASMYSYPTDVLSTEKEKGL